MLFSKRMENPIGIGKKSKKKFEDETEKKKAFN